MSVQKCITLPQLVLLCSFLLVVNFVQTEAAQEHLSPANRTLTGLNLFELSSEQRVAIDKLRQQVLPHIEKDYMKKDFYLMRWLEAKSWNVADAEQLLTQNLLWRKQNRMDTIDQENWTDMIRDYPYEIDTYDKFGGPVATLSARKWDIRRASSQGRVPRLQRYMFKLLEDLTNKVHEARAEGKNVTHWSALINAEGFGLFQHACPSCVPVWLNFVRSATERYPGYADTITLINVPRTLVRILRPIFSSDSLHLYGSDRKTWKTINEKIDREQRTLEYGGSKARHSNFGIH